MKRAAETALQNLGMKKSDPQKIPNPEEDPPSIEPMSLIPPEERERRDDREERRSPTPEEGTRETREVRIDEEDGSPDDRRRRRFKYEDSSDSELNSLNQVEGPKASLNVIWATVDSGAATSCLPVGMCREKGLNVEKTTDLPYTTASGAPVKVHGICHPHVTLGDQDRSCVAGTGIQGYGRSQTIAISGKACKQRLGSMLQARELIREVPGHHHSLRGKGWSV